MKLPATFRSNETLFFYTGAALPGMNNQNHFRHFREPFGIPQGFGLRWQAERDTAFVGRTGNFRNFPSCESAVAAALRRRSPYSQVPAVNARYRVSKFSPGAESRGREVASN